MLIRTIDELEALPDGAIIRDGYETVGEKTADGWQFPCGRDIPSQNVKIPAQLICPRRYGDDDVERVAEIMKQHAPRYGSYHLAGCMCGDNLNHKDFRVHVARAALDALETGNIPPEEATAATMAGKNNTNQQNTAEEGNYDH